MGIVTTFVSKKKIKKQNSVRGSIYTSLKIYTYIYILCLVIEIRRCRSDRNAAEFYGYPYFTFYHIYNNIY